MCPGGDPAPHMMVKYLKKGYRVVHRCQIAGKYHREDRVLILILDAFPMSDAEQLL
jgi:hypothetical protein